MISEKTKKKPKASAAKPRIIKTAAKNAPAVRKLAKTAGLKKQYSKTKPVCRVTFMLPEAAAPAASNVCIAGDFNNWDAASHPLRRLKSGDFTISIDLEPGREYQFRYIIDAVRWENDWHADKYVPSGLAGNDNSVVVV